MADCIGRAIDEIQRQWAKADDDDMLYIVLPNIPSEVEKWSR